MLRRKRRCHSNWLVAKSAVIYYRKVINQNEEDTNSRFSRAIKSNQENIKHCLGGEKMESNQVSHLNEICICLLMLLIVIMWFSCLPFGYQLHFISFALKTFEPLNKGKQGQKRNANSGIKGKWSQRAGLPRM